MPDLPPTEVLIVDDDKQFCNLLADSFEVAGYRPIKAFDGLSALEHFQDQPPAVVLLDVAMPGLNGFEVAEKMRQLESGTNRHTLIVLMTAHARTFFVSQEFEANVDSYLTKPMLPSDIIAHVANMLG